jgi:hypothetical protein
VPGRSALVTTVRGNTITSSCNMWLELGNYVTWSAPGSPNVHIFTGDPIGGPSKTPGRHLLKRFDP